MNKKCIVIGTGGQCRVILSLIFDEQQQFEPLAILDVKFNNMAETIMDVPVNGGLDMLEHYIQQGIKNIFLAIGNNQLRAEMYHLVKNYGYELPNLFSAKANISGYSHLGEGNIVCPFANIGPQSIIGNNNIVNNTRKC